MLRIKELRKEKGISQEELANAINVKNYTIGNWERDRAEPSIEAIMQMADYFEVSTDYILGRSNEIGQVQTNANLASDEVQLLDLYRQMNFQDKNQLIGFAKALVY